MSFHKKHANRDGLWNEMSFKACCLWNEMSFHEQVFFEFNLGNSWNESSFHKMRALKLLLWNGIAFHTSHEVKWFGWNDMSFHK